MTWALAHVLRAPTRIPRRRSSPGAIDLPERSSKKGQKRAPRADEAGGRRLVNGMASGQDKRRQERGDQDGTEDGTEEKTGPKNGRQGGGSRPGGSVDTPDPRCYQVRPSGRRAQQEHQRPFGGRCEQEDISTAPQEPTSYPWFSQAHEVALGPRGDSAPTAQGSPPAHRLRLEEVGTPWAPRRL